MAQSTGGGGGRAYLSIGLAVSLGGDGRSGGAGGTVNVENHGNVQTDGKRSDGVVAQSQGGGGGHAGGAGGIVALGGKGGSGGDGGQVDLTNTGAVTTHQDSSRGLFALSIGGGGGFGGNTGGLVAIGGRGGANSGGGNVTVSNFGGVDTTGSDSHGIEALSVGYGGGDSIMELDELDAAGSSGSGGGGGGAGGVFFTLGGTGAGGGNGGNADVINAGDVTTQGENARGITVQSIGAGGGNGGGSYSGSAFVGVAIGGAAGQGGDGGTASLTSQPILRPFADYIALITPTISTSGDGADGVFVQSVGGGGGDAGLAVQVAGGAFGAVSVGVGGTGGAGGTGGSAELHGTANVITDGSNAPGVTVQSVGGGGGTGGGVVSVGIAGGPGAGSVAVGVGGRGGLGGAGGAVTVDAGGDITTTGDMSEGFYAHSIGGGGGRGGWSVTVDGAGGPAVGVAVGVGVGGKGGGGGDGGTVDATYAGTIATSGEDADGWIAQSVGNGGGKGGFDVTGAIAGSAGGSNGVAVGVGGDGGDAGNGGHVSARLTGAVTTSGYMADGVIAHSVGGGGGTGAFNVAGQVSIGSVEGIGASWGVGGAGGGGGDGGQVDLTVFGDVTTHGASTVAALAQSEGGGGGNGGWNVSGGGSGAATAGGAITVGFGGSGGNGGDGADVTNHIEGTVTTTGLWGAGIVTQSGGGGGGNGAFSVSGGVGIAAAEGSGAVAFGMGGAGGDGGDGAKAVSTLIGDVITAGDGAVGVSTQSLGGGGGRGGWNVSGGLAGASSGSGALTIGIGGAGGGGGNSSLAQASIQGDVTTNGIGADAVFVQSLGGGGGQGGVNVSGGATASGTGNGNVAIGIGGAGGAGGDSVAWLPPVVDPDTLYYAAFADVQGNLATFGQSANAITVQSIGGGGGQGGMNVSGGLNASGEGAGGLSFGIGGSGGDGGNGAAAGLNFQGDIRTAGAYADGVLVQSQGGGGGSGALNVSGNVALTSTTSVPIAIGVGGFGGGGGDAREATLTLVGNVDTAGASSDAVTVQSVGGGGGDGGVNISGDLGVSMGGTAFGTSLGLGGFGGEGGSSGNVTANITGNVMAHGLAREVEVPLLQDPSQEICQLMPALCQRQTLLIEGGSSGIIAQSVGGSGGRGGLDVAGGIAGSPESSGTLNIGVGGFGGGGGDAGTVDLTVNAGQLLANGDYQNVVSAQSIGGGGGKGGANVALGITGNGQFTLGVGGFGGQGGKGDVVHANVTGDMTGSGIGSRGLLVQSVGGAGGDGGFNVVAGINGLPSGEAPSAVLGMGGFGGAGNSSDAVVVHQSGTITMRGMDSIGLLAQSVAGGGGAGAWNVGGTGALGKGHYGTLGIGGKGGDGADAGDVTVASDGAVTVDARARNATGNLLADPVNPEDVDYRLRANGIVVQSIGGGGGQGGVNLSGVIAPVGNAYSAGVGGTGGGGGNAGTVRLDRGLVLPSQLETFGQQSNGIVVQSVGGGGGNAGADVTFNLNGVQGETNPYEANIIVGGAGGAPGNGNVVTVNHVGNVTTHGDQSLGLLAQSVGGGGGNAAFSLGLGLNKAASGVNVAVGGGPGDGGSGRAVTVDHNGALATEGDDSTALFAQSIGGGGGNAALTMALALLADNKLNVGLGRRGGTGGAADAVTVTARGVVSTAGDRSEGILAQSVGNGGGKSGGLSISGKGTSSGDSGENSTTGTGGLAVGLEGGEGGTSGLVHVDSYADISTRGKDAPGLHAQSVGGGGGIGGSAINPVIRDTNSGFVDVGGEGGTGGVSGNIEVMSTGTISTSGQNAHGIYAQSTGGGGGTGGLAALFTLGLGGAAANGANNFGVSVGGTGGQGAASGTVNVENDGAILTRGGNAAGVLAESVAGGGGDGGMVINGAFFGEGRTSQGSLNVGGHGGDGAQANTVTVENFGSIRTEGGKAPGILAQSVGDGGGNGGLVVNFDLPVGANDGGSGSGAINVGGFGGTGGAAGAATVTNHADATIVTTGKESYGIFAQSVGGGGGNGGGVVSLMRNGSAGEGGQTYSGSLTVGGWGGTGGTGADATVTNEGLIDTAGEGAHGIFAQSISNGGGNGGFAIAVNASQGTSAPTFSTLAVAVGGGGGDGADAGPVVVENAGSIITRGDHADGIFAQSVGGSGGNANVGLSLSGSSLASSGIVNVLSGALGASGLLAGSGAGGSTVEVAHTGDITVLGRGSEAIHAQSLNGGGGGYVLDLNSVTTLPGAEGLPGVPAGSDPGVAVPILTLRAGGAQQANTAAAAVSIHDNGTYGVAADEGTGMGVQSIGGGGGTAQVRLSFAAAADARPMDVSGQLGAEQVTNAAGGEIHSEHTGDIITTGAHALAGSAQSIGGGGGRNLLDVAAHSGSLGDVDFSLGAIAGSANDGGAVVQMLTGNTYTGADNGVGFLVQSIGAGGGEVHAKGIDALAVTLGGANGAAGNGGDIDFQLTGLVQTSGARAHGVILQSIGGGGGAVFTDMGAETNVDLSDVNSGDGGAIDFTLHGDILTQGAESMGLIVQSLGGGGGFVDGMGAFSAGGTGAGGAITVSLNSSIYAEQSTGIYLQSRGSNGGGPISLSVAADGHIVGGEESPALVMNGGSANTLLNHGFIGSLAGESGTAVSATSGDDAIDNSGTLLGDIDLGAGANALVNETGGQVLSGGTIHLGAGNRFSNAGLLAPGGSGVVRTTALDGEYVQGSSGLAQMDLDLATNTMDALSATGTVALDGTVNVDLLNVQNVRPGGYFGTLFAGSAGATDAGIVLETAPSVVISYALTRPNPSLVSLAYNVDFAAFGQLAPHQQAVGQYLNRVQVAGSSPALANLVRTLVDTADLNRYRQVMTELSADFYAGQQGDTLRMAEQFGHALKSCDAQSIALRYVRQGSCVWLRLDAPNTRMKAREGSPTMHYDGRRFAIGGQRTWDAWTVGLGLSSEDFSVDGNGDWWSGQGETTQVGAVAKYQVGNALIASSAVFGQTTATTQRRFDVLGASLTSGNQRLSFASVATGVDYRVATPWLTVKPLVEVGYTHLHGSGGWESGAGALDLVRNASKEDHVWIRPGVEFSRPVVLASHASFKPYVRASWLDYVSGHTTSVSAALRGAPADVQGMRSVNDLGTGVLGLDVGLSFMSAAGNSLELNYERTSSTELSGGQAMVKFAMHL